MLSEQSAQENHEDLSELARLHELLSDVLGLIDPEKHPDLVEREEAVAAPRAEEDARDARRYRRLRLLGAAPSTSPVLEQGTVLRFQGLDGFVDADIQRQPDRGEAQPSPAAPRASDEAFTVGQMEHKAYVLMQNDKFEAAAMLRYAADRLASQDETPGVEYDNHHNALKCPYCNPNGRLAETPGVRALVEKWREEADGRHTIVAHAKQACADELERLLIGGGR